MGISNLIEVRKKFDTLKGERARVLSELEKCKENLKLRKKDYETHLKAREIIREVGIATQKELSYHIGEIVTMALESVFPDPYRFIVEFDFKHNKTECNLCLVGKNGNVVDAMSSAGGGVVDIVSLALRMASWSMMSPTPAQVLIMDEPLRFLSRDLRPLAGEMIKEFSQKMGLQVIMVSHEDAMIDVADKILTIRKNADGRSVVESRDIEEKYFDNHP